MYKFQIYLFVGGLILIVLYVVGVILDSITTAKKPNLSRICRNYSESKFTTYRRYKCKQ